MRKSRLCCLHGLRMDPESKIFRLGKAIVSCFHLMKEHFRILIPDIIESVFFMGNLDALLKIRYIRCHIFK